MAAIGIRRYASKRLQLFTDLPPEKARPLPPLMDQLFEAWVNYFGPPAPDREGTEFQMTGYLMVDQKLFRESGLLPEDLPGFLHGRNRQTRFWLNDQPTDYYRRHLLFHEGTHCFMTAVAYPERNRVWYMEGMAELFATHRIDAKGRAEFRVLPHDREQFANLGRIRLIEEEVRKSGPRSLQSVLHLLPESFLANDPYAWSWGVCQFLDGHPRYAEAFRRFNRCVSTGVPELTENELLFEKFPDLAEEWLLFAGNLCHGYDQLRAAIEFSASAPLAEGKRVSVEIDAARGWQASGVAVEKGMPISISATGRVVIAKSSASDEAGSGEKGVMRAWESEAQGISIRYHAGEPLGKLLAVIRESGAATNPGKEPSSSMLQVIPIGNARRFTPEISGGLYFRVNDAWNELAENSGRYQVEIRQGP